MQSLKDIDYKKHTIKIYQDEDPQSPRDWDNLGTMLCFHRDYVLGDKHTFTVEEARDIAKRKDVVALPLFLIDHSGISMRTHSFNDVDPGEWDSGQVGIIYVEYEKIKKEYNVKRVTKKTLDKVLRVLRQEVSTFDDYITGNVYGFDIESPDGESIESVWGFFGDPESYMVPECKGTIDHAINEARRAHIQRLKAQIKAGAPLSVRTPLEVTT